MIVVDASAVREMLLLTPRADAAFGRTLLAGESLQAPHVLDLEVTQALRRYAARSELGAAAAERHLEDSQAFSIERYPHAAFLERIWQLRAGLSACDASYVALAEALDCPLHTADARLARTSGHEARIGLIR